MNPKKGADLRPAPFLYDFLAVLLETVRPYFPEESSTGSQTLSEAWALAPHRLQE